MDFFEQDWAWQAAMANRQQCQLTEVYDGEAINDWHRRKIRLQLHAHLKAYDGINDEYATMLKEFISIWEEKKLYDGAVNTEVVQELLDATRIMAARDWPLKDFFINLEASLSNILASESKLPRLPLEPTPQPKSLTAKKTLSKEVPPLFGPLKTQPNVPAAKSAANSPTPVTPATQLT